MFVSKPEDGRVYFAQHSAKGLRCLLWSVIPVAGDDAAERIDAGRVPRRIRRRAYSLFARGRSAAVLLALAAALLAPPAEAQTRDASGRTIGTVSTDSNGQRTFRDGSGRTTGTATTDSNGTTTFRDGSGRIKDTTERERRR